eukprot:SM000159S01779  [mRNA]  locus=s159:106179:108257:- [translate_table: standard]
MPQSGEDGTQAAEQLARWRVGDLPTVYCAPDYVTPAEEALLLKQVYGVPNAKWRVVRNRRLQEWGDTFSPPTQSPSLFPQLGHCAKALVVKAGAGALASFISSQTGVHNPEQQPRRVPGGTVHEKGMIPQAMPTWLAALAARLEEDFNELVSPINHILINEYAPGQGIMRHQDGPLYYPVVLILSLGLPAIMQFHPHQGLLAEGAARGHPPPPVLPVTLPPRSLLIFKDAAYQDYLHEISEVIDANAVERSDGEGPESKAQVPLSAAWAQARVSLTCRRVEKVRAKLFRL